MKKDLVNYKKAAIAFCSWAVFYLSCTKQPLQDAAYPASTIYLNEAALTTVPSGTDIYTVAARVEGQVNTYNIDTANARFNIPLGVTRSGISNSGSVVVGIAANTDTVSKMMANGNLDSSTVLLPSTAYVLPASVTVPDGSSSGSFSLSVDLNFLLNNLTTDYAIGITIAAPKGKSVTTTLSTVVVYIKPSLVLSPVANFTSYVYSDTKTANFLNLSANSGQYSWDFGDGSPASAVTSPSHVYTASGTYQVTLTATGITGNPGAATETTSIVIP